MFDRGIGHVSSIPLQGSDCIQLWEDVEVKGLRDMM